MGEGLPSAVIPLEERGSSEGLPVYEVGSCVGGGADRSHITATLHLR